MDLQDLIRTLECDDPTDTASAVMLALQTRPAPTGDPTHTPTRLRRPQ